MTRRELTRRFRIHGETRRPFRELLRKMVKKEQIIKQDNGAYSMPLALPNIMVVEINMITPDGDAFATPVSGGEDSNISEEQLIEVLPAGKKSADKSDNSSFAEGDRVLARLTRIDDGSYQARVIRRLDKPQNRILGIIRKQKNGFALIPVDKKAKFDFIIPPEEIGNAQEGDFVVGEAQPARRGSRQKQARIIEIIGHENDRKAISLISAYEMGLQDVFPQSVIDETQNMTVPELGKREDLRDIPLVTIDGITAKDFDDAVYAEKTEDGFHLIVAIADVSYYVRAGSSLDDEALRRGNSTYFPDRVIPMLPEKLSNDLCSLRPDENRACLAAHLWIDNEGDLTNYKFVRGLMKSKARLVYEQVQAAKDGTPDDTTAPLMDEVITPLYEAYDVLYKHRLGRHALELDLPERDIVLNDDGEMHDVRTRERMDSHKLIEEFMILANVAAAKALEAKRAPCVYRVHENPDSAKLESIRSFLEAFGLSFPRGQVIRGKELNNLLLQAAELPYSHLISEVILRAQSQAHYGIQNYGHFGLALTQYAHFTSPIRRYADLLVHRSLITAYKLGEGGLSEDDMLELEEQAVHISATERTSISAERKSVDRFIASYLSDQIGARFEGRITGVTRYGLFVRLIESGAEGLIPIRSLPDDYYEHVEDQHALIGKRTRRTYRLGATLTVELLEADGVTGGTILGVTDDKGADIPGLTFKSSRKDGGSRPPRSNKGGKKSGGGSSKFKNSGFKKKGSYKGKKPGSSGKKH